jgi:hypothetical protein
MSKKEGRYGSGRYGTLTSPKNERDLEMSMKNEVDRGTVGSTKYQRTFTIGSPV